ncbi:MAG: hypothetical protein ACLR5N_08460 [Haemophilus parainfluenzae]
MFYSGALVVLMFVGSFTGGYLAIAHILPEEWSFIVRSPRL